MSDGVNNHRISVSGAALHQLLRASEHARQVDVDTWEFAVEISDLRSQGLAHSDLRRLIHEGLVEHAFETTRVDDPRREFSKPCSTLLSESSCFVLTDLGIQTARRIESGTIDYQRPTWDPQNRELSFNGKLIKRYRCPAQNQEAILSAFEEEEWALRIDDPLPPIAQQCPKRRLHDTIKSMNRHHVQCVIRFGGDGTGEGIVWDVV
ncbi:hypothetical protein RMSM_05735 [Rhodopirellula maiorica SM1]|uniref:Uncharacterized protein n=1 Tax=Rhodopirellula maiorica SM1 TaxID=1265738 RepID=M5RPP1_9BACT|nr:hypothetical protein [Rhodopirellula maiorica]EMI17342.1 hypothetical protein RMSM_05735 [Rhodopirellula maiorica SM1]